MNVDAGSIILGLIVILLLVGGTSILVSIIIEPDYPIEENNKTYSVIIDDENNE